ncbi:hypothetical protein BBP00_00007390 [Phytophthora kernoviae]|nr:hypothetical protein BBP00_00007390 [Phytophthora kernoviae]
MELCTKEVLVMEFLKGRKLLDGIQDHFEVIAADKGVTIEFLKQEQEQKDKEREAQGLDIETGPSSLQLRLYGLSLGAKRLVRRIGRVSYDYTLGFVAPVKWTLREDEKHQLLNLPEILKLIMDVHGYEIFVDGSFNGDPHPGNIMLLEDGRLGLIDYGQVKHISQEHRVHLAKLIVALAGGSRGDIIEVLTKDMRIRTTNMDPYFLEKQARLMIDNDDRFVTEGMNAQLFLEHLHTIDRIEYIPDEYVMAFRCSLLLRGFSYLLHYKFSHAKSWESVAKQVIHDVEVEKANTAPATA